MERSDSGRAATVGVLCIATYLANYYLRNILSVLTPALLETGDFTVEYVGFLSSTYMVLYAIGQLINGFLGDRLSPKRMAVCGILVAGGASCAFPFLPIGVLQILCFAVFGFGLSMVRGPLMKIISENTKPNHARTICVFFSFASFAGPLIAGLIAMINNWTWVFLVAGGVAAVIAVLAYAVLSVMEKKGSITYKTTSGEGLSSILSVFKIERFVFYMVVACLVEISAASISFWIPTFLTEYLQFDKNTANMVFAGISALRSLMPFVSLAIFRLTGERDVAMMRVTFLLTALLFAGLLAVPGTWGKLILLLLALMSMSCTSALLWSIYIPGLGKTGRVSSVNGVLDCTGYIAAALANLLFAGMMGSVGWNAVFLLWSGIGVIGLIATVFVRRKKA